MKNLIFFILGVILILNISSTLQRHLGSVDSVPYHPHDIVILELQGKDYKELKNNIMLYHKRGYIVKTGFGDFGNNMFVIMEKY